MPKKVVTKSFEETLKELDDMIRQDIENFKKQLHNLSVRENTDNFFEQEESLMDEFENPLEISNLAENQTNLLNLHEDSRPIDYGKDRISEQ